MKSSKLSMGTLLLLISFASVNAVLFTPALPSIAVFFNISETTSQYTLSWFLMGYALGQLIYGPLANRLGRKKAIYAGIVVQIISCFVCVASAYTGIFAMLVIGRFFLALGSGVGLKMSFTIVNESCEPKVASQKIAFLMLAFAITPALAVALGGYLTLFFRWESCFYVSSLYGLLLLVLVRYLPETKKNPDKDALKLGSLLVNYSKQFRSQAVVTGGIVMGICSSYIYIFSALAPFIAMNLFNISSSKYGIANLIPPIGLIAGSLTASRLATQYSLVSLMRMGIIFSLFGGILMLLAYKLQYSIYIWMFLSVVPIYFGLCFVMSNASTLALAQVEDKAYGSAVLNFINMGFATLMVLSLNLLSIEAIILPLVFCIFSLTMLIVCQKKC